MGKRLPEGTVIRGCPNCHEELRIRVSGAETHVALTGRKQMGGDVSSVMTPDPEGPEEDDGRLYADEDREKCSSLEAGGGPAGLVELLAHLQSAEAIARDALIRGQVDTSLHGEEGPTPGPIEIDEPYSGPVNEIEPASERPFNLPAEMVVRLRIKVEVDGISV